MTIDEFIEKLDKTPREWEVLPHGRLRLWRRCCPITAVHGHELMAGAYGLCSLSLGLSAVDAELIVTAADANYQKWISEVSDLRSRLLAACGLEG